MSEWKEYVLDDIIDKFIDYRGKTPKKTTEGIPLITAKVVKNGKILEPNEFIAEEDYDSWMTRGLPHVNDVVLTTEAPLGEVALIKDENIALAQRIITLRGNPEIVSNIYLKYYLQSDRGQYELDSRASGTTVFGIKASVLKELPIALPPLTQQKAIASILFSLDNKIDLLYRQNKTLEQMAETLFRQWFIEEAKEDWGEGELGDLIEVKYGKDHKKLLDGNIPVYGSGGIMRFADNVLYDSESVLVPRKGTLNNVIHINEPFWTVDTMFYTVMKKPNLAKFIYHFLNRQDLAAMNVGSAVPSMTTNILNCMPLLLPPEDVLEKFELTATPYYSKIESNKKQISTLENLRDTLLPKLMSGEVRVDLDRSASALIKVDNSSLTEKSDPKILDVKESDTFTSVPFKSLKKNFKDDTSFKKLINSLRDEDKRAPLDKIEPIKDYESEGETTGKKGIAKPIGFEAGEKVDKTSGGKVEVFYGTNRNINDRLNVRNYFGSKLDKLRLGSCLINIPKNHAEGRIERPRNYIIYKSTESEDKHVVLSKIIELNSTNFYDKINATFSELDDKSALIFIHGYNNSFEEVAWRTGQLAWDLPFDGVTGFFSWPSAAKTTSYLADVEMADASAKDFKSFLKNLVLNTGIEKLHLVAHSMGSRILTTALKELKNDPFFRSKTFIIEQLILAAPDLDQIVFRNNLLPYFIKLGKRRTLYASKKDKALNLAEKIRIGMPRLGDAGNQLFIADGIDTIDASNVKSWGNHHSYVFETNEVLTDLFYLFKDGFGPDKRRLKRQSKDGLDYWLFNK